VNLVETVKENNGDVKIFSSLHVSGERMFMIYSSLSSPFVRYLKYELLPISAYFLELAQVTGIAAILRFPMPELEDIAVDDETEADES